MDSRCPNNIIGSSLKLTRYKEWIHEKKKCFCNRKLSLQEGWLHHDQNSGGKKNPRDQLLTRFCCKCHAELHYSAASKAKLFKYLNLTDEKVRDDTAKMLGEYILDEYGANELINAISKSLEEV